MIDLNSLANFCRNQSAGLLPVLLKYSRLVTLCTFPFLNLPFPFYSTGDLNNYFFGNFKTSNIIWRYAVPCQPVMDRKMNDLEWPWVAISRKTRISGRAWVWTLNCDFTRPAFFKFYCTVRCRHNGPRRQMTHAGCSLFTRDASVRYWASDGRITWRTST